MSKLIQPIPYYDLVVEFAEFSKEMIILGSSYNCIYLAQSVKLLFSSRAPNWSSCSQMTFAVSYKCIPMVVI